MLHQVPERRKQATSREHNIFTRTDSVTPPSFFYGRDTVIRNSFLYIYSKYNIFTSY